MITFSKLGRKGRLGNQLFHVAGMIGLAKKYGHELKLPVWKYRKFFQPHNMWVEGAVGGQRQILKEEDDFHYVPDFWERLNMGSWDIDAWLQTEKLWDHCKEDIKAAFTWETNYLAHVLNTCPIKDFSNTIAISVRRGDYVKNRNYDQLPVSYYMQALMQEFPDWRERQIMIFSDDIAYCKLHFQGLPNVWFAENDPSRVEGSAALQLCLMSQCQGFVIANSTFSWWGAYLAELRDPSVKIVRPAYLFAGPLLERSDSRDHWPDRWTVYDHKNPDGSFKKYDLSDVTFTIPVMYDHPDRRHNLNLNVCLLQRVFDTKIVIGEMALGGAPYQFSYMNEYCHYRMFVGDRFHRTYMLNVMAKETNTPFVANWDADVAVPEVQVIMAVDQLRRGVSDGVYPYDGRFARVPRKPWFNILEQDLDLGIYKDEEFKGATGQFGSSSVGGAVIWNRNSFLNGGGENEYFISHAPEDAERWDRFRFLGFNVHRIVGKLFHMDHWVGPNSSSRHEDMPANRDHLKVIRDIIATGNVDKMWLLVMSWPWYSPIKGGSIRDVEWEVAKQLIDDNSFTGFDSGPAVSQAQ